MTAIEKIRLTFPHRFNAVRECIEKVAQDQQLDKQFVTEFIAERIKSIKIPENLQQKVKGLDKVEVKRTQDVWFYIFRKDDGSVSNWDEFYTTIFLDCYAKVDIFAQYTDQITFSEHEGRCTKPSHYTIQSYDFKSLGKELSSHGNTVKNKERLKDIAVTALVNQQDEIRGDYLGIQLKLESLYSSLLLSEDVEAAISGDTEILDQRQTLYFVTSKLLDKKPKRTVFFLDPVSFDFINALLSHIPTVMSLEKTGQTLNIQKLLPLFT